jgi:diguanylate cyclase (GGDEF)-like protein
MPLGKFPLNLSAARTDDAPMPTLPKPPPSDETALMSVLVDRESGLLNGAFFNLRLEEEFKKSWRFTWSYSLLLLDVEGLAPFEQAAGRPAANSAVLDIAGEILTASRDVDLSARLGRSRFGMLLPGTPAEGARIMVQRLITQVLTRLDQRLSLSVGVAEAPQAGLKTVEEFLAHAESALQLARSQGRNQIATWNAKTP